MAKKSGIKRAVTIAGSQQKLADDLGVTRQYVGQMVALGYAPDEYALAINKAHPHIPLETLVHPKRRALINAAKS